MGDYVFALVFGEVGEGDVFFVFSFVFSFFVFLFIVLLLFFIFVLLLCGAILCVLLGVSYALVFVLFLLFFRFGLSLLVLLLVLGRFLLKQQLESRSKIQSNKNKTNLLPSQSLPLPRSLHHLLLLLSFIIPPLVVIQSLKQFTSLDHFQLSYKRREIQGGEVYVIDLRRARRSRASKYGHGHGNFFELRVGLRPIWFSALIRPD